MHEKNYKAESDLLVFILVKDVNRFRIDSDVFFSQVILCHFCLIRLHYINILIRIIGASVL